jgi:hypothetical protein
MVEPAHDAPRVVVEHRVFQFERRTGPVVRRRRPRSDVVVVHGIDDHRRGISKRDDLAAVAQLAGRTGGDVPLQSADVSGGGLEHRRIFREHEVSVTRDRHRAEIDRERVDDRPAGQAHGARRRVVELDELRIRVGRGVMNLVDDNLG